MKGLTGRERREACKVLGRWIRFRSLKGGFGPYFGLHIVRTNRGSDKKKKSDAVHQTTSDFKNCIRFCNRMRSTKGPHQIFHLHFLPIYKLIS